MYHYKEDYSLKSDEEILAISLTKPSFFEEIVRRYQGPFLAKAKWVMGDREEVVDIVQDTFTKIYVNARRFTESEQQHFKAWGYKILMNTTFTYYAKLKREREAVIPLDTDLLEGSFPEEKEGTEHAIQRMFMEDQVIAVFSKMPRHLARVLKLHFLEGYSQKEIAEKEGLSVGAVKTRVHRAKKEFKRTIYHSGPII